MAAAASAALWFDFFLTRPNQQLTINDEDGEIELLVESKGRLQYAR